MKKKNIIIATICAIFGIAIIKKIINRSKLVDTDDVDYVEDDEFDDTNVNE
jgi:hypothetical protein